MGRDLLRKGARQCCSLTSIITSSVIELSVVVQEKNIVIAKATILGHNNIPEGVIWASTWANVITEQWQCKLPWAKAHVVPFNHPGLALSSVEKYLILSWFRLTIFEWGLRFLWFGILWPDIAAILFIWPLPNLSNNLSIFESLSISEFSVSSDEVSPLNCSAPSSIAHPYFLSTAAAGLLELLDLQWRNFCVAKSSHVFIYIWASKTSKAQKSNLLRRFPHYCIGERCLWSL